MSVTTKRAATVSEPDERKLEAHIQQPAHAPEGAVRAAQFTDENKQSQWNKATESYRTSSLDSATMIALSDDMIAKLKRDGNYQKFELYDPEAPGNGSAQDTGTVIEYDTQELQKGELFSLGMDYEEGRVLTPDEKLQEFLRSAATSATDPKQYKRYIQGEINKLIGVAEGMNQAKEETKAGVAAGWKALTDGTVAHFLSKPNAINEPLFRAIGTAFDSMAKDPHALNKATFNAVEALGNAIVQGSELYEQLPDREKGHVIGHAAFALINPQGSTKSGEAALTIADTVATHVDAAVLKTIDQSLESIRKAPDLAADIKQGLYNYIKEQGLTAREVEAAGIPREFFDDIQQTTGRRDDFFAMSKADEPHEGLPRRADSAGVIQYQVDKGTGRLQRTDLGKVRRPYTWEVLNEQFSSDILRQSTDDSCISAVGQMLSNGRITEQELIAKLDARPDITDLLKHLGTGWTDEARRFRSLAEIGEHGPWAAELVENGGTELEKSLHAVVVEGLSPSGNPIIRDPWEGTKYEIPLKHFLENVWTGRAIYRTEP